MVYKLTLRDNIILEHPIDFKVSSNPSKDHTSLELFLIQFNFPSCENSIISDKVFGCILNRRLRATTLDSNREIDFIPLKFRNLVKFLKTSEGNSIDSQDVRGFVSEDISKQNNWLKDFLDDGSEIGLLGVIKEEFDIRTYSSSRILNRTRSGKRVILTNAFLREDGVIAKIIETPINPSPYSVRTDLHTIDLSFPIQFTQQLYQLTCEQLLAIQFRPDCSRKTKNTIFLHAQDIFLRRRSEYHFIKSKSRSSYEIEFLLDKSMSAREIIISSNRWESSYTRNLPGPLSRLPMSHPLFRRERKPWLEDGELYGPYGSPSPESTPPLSPLPKFNIYRGPSISGYESLSTPTLTPTSGTLQSSYHSTFNAGIISPPNSKIRKRTSLPTTSSLKKNLSSSSGPSVLMNETFPPSPSLSPSSRSSSTLLSSLPSFRRGSAPSSTSTSTSLVAESSTVPSLPSPPLPSTSTTKKGALKRPNPYAEESSIVKKKVSFPSELPSWIVPVLKFPNLKFSKVKREEGFKQEVVVELEQDLVMVKQEVKQDE